MGTTSSKKGKPASIPTQPDVYKIPDDTINFLINDTSLPEYFIRAMCKLFEDSCDSRGHLDREKFCQLFQGRMKLTDDLKNFLLSLYRAYDDDGNSVLDAQEFIQMLNIVLCGDMHEKLTGIFRMCDRDGNNVIDKTELNTIMLCLAPFVDQKTEADKRKYLLDLADELFQKFDIDGDGVITMVEFQKGGAKHPKLLAEIENVIKICMGNGF